MERPNLLLRHFKAGSLSPQFIPISGRFLELAEWLEDTLPAGPEKTVAFRKLLEARDCAARCVLDEPASSG